MVAEVIQTKMTVEEIIKGCKTGKKRAQKALYDQYADRIMGVCCRYVSVREEAEDVFQESMVKIFKNMHKVEEVQTFWGWMKRITVNTALNHLRDHKKHYYHEEAENMASSNMDYEQMLGNLSAQEIVELIDQLPEGYKTICQPLRSGGILAQGHR
jgi:RNA polymerase sigma-70 factor (ECF subfamily)